MKKTCFPQALKAVAFLTFLFFYQNCFAQDDIFCGTENPTSQELQAYLQLIHSGALPIHSNQMVSIPIHFVLVTDDDGNSDWKDHGVGMEELIDKTNLMYTNNINFYICSIDEIKNSNLLFFDVLTEYSTIWDMNHVDDAINVYLVDRVLHNGPKLGYAPSINQDLPWGNSLTIGSNSIPDRTLAHELGHYFGLVHTNTGNPFVNTPVCSLGAEFVCSDIYCNTLTCSPGQICVIDGDGICDTPADPGPSACPGGCNVPCPNSVVDPFGNTYNPDKHNLMSTYDCMPQYFSPEQLQNISDCLYIHPKRTFLLSANPTCELIPNDFGVVSRACQPLGSNSPQLDLFGLVDVEVTNGNTGFTRTIKTGNLLSPNGSTSLLAGKYKHYQILDFAYSGDDVTITCRPKKEDYFHPAYYYLNGVTMNDINLLRNHINGVMPLQNKPYGWIAGDVSNDGILDAFDLVLISKALLGIPESFQIGSWRFVPSYYLTNSQFLADFNSNPLTAVWHGGSGDDRAYLQQINSNTNSGPYTFPPSPPSNANVPATAKSYMDFVEINMQNSAVSNVETWSFQGVKTGDVDCSANLSADGIVQPGDDGDVVITTEAHECFQANDEALVLVKANGTSRMTSYQLGFEFDHTAIQVLGVSEGDVPSFSLSNFNIDNSEEGTMRTIWIEETGTTPFNLGSQKVLYKMHVKFLKPVCDFSSVFDLESEVLSSIFFDNYGNSSETSLSMKLIKDNVHHTFTNIYPNPFTNSVSFDFSLNTPQTVSIQLTDIYGNSQFSSGNYSSGNHTHSFQPADVFQDGVIYYKVLLGGEIFTGTIARM